MSSVLLVTCEHGGNQIPREYRDLFHGANDVLESHRGWDPGALRAARQLAKQLQVELISSTTSRLLVELNRSLHHPRLFSEFTIGLAASEKQQILNRWWHPHRRQIVDWIGEAVRQGQQVVHVGVHSFTPVLNGSVRRTDIGLLYDPRRPSERRLCTQWGRLLKGNLPEMVIHRNQPYRGAADGLTTWLRTQFEDRCYVGIELEINHRDLHPWTSDSTALIRSVGMTLAEVCG